jgi:TonB-linked SusC/RagA family outer membrane protein
LNLSHVSSNQKLNFNFSGSYLFDDNNLFNQDLTGDALTLPPNAPEIFDSNGNLNWENSSWPNYNPFSPLRQKYRVKTDNMVNNLRVDYLIIKGLHLKTNLGHTKMNLDEIKIYPTTTFDPAWGALSGYTLSSNSSIKTWIVEPQVDYQTTLSQGKLTAIIGSTFQQNIQEGQTYYAYGFTSDALLENILAASSINALEATSIQYRYNALFGRVNYDWKEKYFINATARRDGSSRFGPGKKFSNFGAIGAAWIFSKESFCENLAFLSYGKLRTSYGITGSDQIGDYQYLSTYSVTSAIYQGSKGLYPTRLMNPNFAWETNKKFEVAIETGFLQNRILFKASYYLNRSSNQLVGYALPQITGFSTIQYNLPAKVENKGIEIELSLATIAGKSFTWNTSFNLTFPTNKLLQYPNIEGSPYANSLIVGQPLSIIKTFHYAGVNQQTGTYAFQDLDNDANISFPNDLASHKNISQIYYGGLQNTLNYKGIELDFFFQFVEQSGRNYLNFFQAPGTMSNQSVDVLNRWQPSKTSADIQRYTQDYNSAAYSAYYNIIRSDYTISDASFIRLKSLSLSYQLSQGLIQNAKLSRFKIYIQGQNLITITKFKGIDPENQNYTVLPPLKILTGGIQVTF